MPDSVTLPYHLAQLADLCRDHPFDSKIVFVPSLQIGHNLGTALARAGVSWVNLHLTTPRDWAATLVESKLRADGWRPLVQGADHFFMLDAVRQIEWPDHHPFEEGNPATGLARTFLKTARALRAADIRPEMLASAEIALPKRRIFIDLYTRYCRWLDSERLYDDSRLFWEAQRTRHDASIVAILDETPLSESAFRFVGSMGDSIIRIGRSDYGRPGPQHSALIRMENSPQTGCTERVGPGGRLLTTGIQPSDHALLAVREAIGAENEIRGLLREWMGRDVHVDEIELAYTSEDPYLFLLIDILERLGLPATFAAGVPVTLTGPGQALKGFYRWIANDFDPEELLTLLRSRLLFLGHVYNGRALPSKGDVSPLSNGVLECTDMARIILDARVRPGRTSWVTALSRFREGLKADMASNVSSNAYRFHERRLILARATCNFLEKLHAMVPRSEHTSLHELALAGAGFLADFARKQTHRDRLASESLRERLTELAEIESGDGHVSDLAASLADLVGEHKVQAAVARPGHMYIVPLDRAGYSGRSETAIVGLSESSFPGTALEDPILLDAERALVSGRLGLQRARVGEPVWHLIRVLGMAAGRVTLTANRRDVIDGRETYPAAIFEQVRGQLGIEHAPIYRAVPSVETALTDDEVAMAMRANRAVTTDILSTHPWLLDGLTAIRNREAAPLGTYDGWLGRETPELRPTTERAISPSRLEELATCPHRYFLRYVLDIRPPDEYEERPGQWLTAAEFGSLLHEVLRSFMEAVSSRGEMVDVDRHSNEMLDHLYATISDYRDRLPVRHASGYHMDVRRLERAVQIFVAEESRRKARPVGFEVSFGMGECGDLAVPDPIVLNLGHDVQLLLRGSIDRIDRSANGYEIWDYKSGSTYDHDEVDLLSGGRRLQWALYAYALEELLTRRGVSEETRHSGYFFPTDREHGLRIGAQPPPRAEVARTLAPLLDLVEKGAFPHVQKSQACTYCDYRAICARERKGKRDLTAIFDEGMKQPFYDALATWMDVDAPVES